MPIKDDARRKAANSEYCRKYSTTERAKELKRKRDQAYRDRQREKLGEPLKVHQWTPEELEVMKHYPFVDNKQLFRMLGGRHSISTIGHKAIALGLVKHRPMRETALRLAARPEGLKAMELNAGELGRRQCQRLVKSGELFKVVISFKNVIYFSSQEAAEKWQRALVPTVKLSKHPGKAHWDKNTPAYIPPGVKIIKCPSPSLDYRTNRAWGIGGPSLMDQL